MWSNATAKSNQAKVGRECSVGVGAAKFYRVIREALYNRLTVGFLGKNVSRQGIQQK